MSHGTPNNYSPVCERFSHDRFVTVLCKSKNMKFKLTLTVVFALTVLLVNGGSIKKNQLYEGVYCSGSGDINDLRLIDESFAFFNPNPVVPNLTMIYDPEWDTFVEGAGWDAWWIQNSYGFAYAATPFLQDPWFSLLQKSLDLFWDNQGDGKRMGRPANSGSNLPPSTLMSLVAPEGSLGDAARPTEIIYKQGDGDIKIHDWFYEATAAGLVMQAEILLTNRDLKAIQYYLPKMERACNFIEQARDSKNNLFLVGPACNLLAPSYGGTKQVDGTFGKGYLAGLSVTYLAALDRIVELYKLTGNGEKLTEYINKRDLTRKSLNLLLTPEGYFVKSLETNGIRHGVLGQKQYAYLEGVVNADAVALRVVDNSTSQKIYNQIMTFPTIRPFDFLLTNAPGLDDTYWNWGNTTGKGMNGIHEFGSWVNGGAWGTVEGRAILMYYRLGKFDDIRRSAQRAMKWSKDFRMDAPWSQQGENTHNVWSDSGKHRFGGVAVMVDNFAIPAATIRGLFDYEYQSDCVVLRPRIPSSIDFYKQKQAIRFGTKKLFLSCENGGKKIASVKINGKKIKLTSEDELILIYDLLPSTAYIEIKTIGGWPKEENLVVDYPLIPSLTEWNIKNTASNVEFPEPLKKPYANLMKFKEVIGRMDGLENVKAFLDVTIKSFENYRVRYGLYPGKGYFRPITEERKNDIIKFYELAATTMFKGFVNKMNLYSKSGDNQQKKIANLFSEIENQDQLTDSQQRLRQYNVVWDSPSEDSNGSMPIGNGDIGLNAWVDTSGRVCFYISKTDSWDENGRLVKIGKICLTSEPAIVFKGSEFKQELDLLTGTIMISSKGKIDGQPVDMKFHLWVDANHPVVQMSYESSVPLKIHASVDLWRTRPLAFKELVYSDLIQNSKNPSEARHPVVVEPDSVLSGLSDKVIWFHHNKKNDGFDFVTKHQGISEFYQSDPLENRTFGALLTSSGSCCVNDKSIETKAARNGNISVYVLTKYPSQPVAWVSEIENLAKRMEKTSFSERRQKHEKWWSNFWNRSWIYASTDSAKAMEADDAFIVSRAYALQRFITASAGRGAYPIKFNGTIFTVPPADTARSKDPDYRQWGPGYWWQNTRLPYISSCTAGDFDLMKPLFKMYGEDIYKISKQRTKKNFGFEGAYFIECMYFWGTQFSADYGPKPWDERTDKLQDSRYHKWEWVCGPELVYMMLDYYVHTGDDNFLKEKIIPISNDIIRFFDSFYSTNEDGRMVMHPSQSAETWWNCTNPMPELAGLYSITRRLLALPDNLTGEQNKKFWKDFNAKLPPIPLRDTPAGKALAPAEKFEQKNNCENPELYAVFPFRLYGVGNPDLEFAKNALEYREDKGNFGWRQDDVFMAYLGLTDQARKYLVGRAKKFNRESRFPAFWGPNYDWVPDQDHGGILMKTFQSMLIQADPYSEKIYLLPAWPKNWNAKFKLKAPRGTTIECNYCNGKIMDLKVTPEFRKKNIVMPVS